jgi:hypothetical protein
MQGRQSQPKENQIGAKNKQGDFLGFLSEFSVFNMLQRHPRPKKLFSCSFFPRLALARRAHHPAIRPSTTVTDFCKGESDSAGRWFGLSPKSAGPGAIYNQVPRKMTNGNAKFDHDDRHFDERRREDRAETDAEGSPCSPGRTASRRAKRSR